jgi:hypothetical protein
MKTLINETYAIIQMEISQALESYPHSYQEVFANPDRRQDLTAYVLNHVGSIYTSLDVEAAHRFSCDRFGNDQFSDDRFASTTTTFPMVVILTIENAIHQGVMALLSQAIPTSIAPPLPIAPSLGRSVDFPYLLEHPREELPRAA